MNIGDKFPQILGHDAEGNEVSLAKWPGKRFIIYFYPKDNTPGCTAEACSLRDGWDDLRALGYEIIGVSKDSGASHARFTQKYSLPFPLVADTEHQLCELAGVWQLKKMAGREYWGIVRTTFVTDAAGIVTDVIRKVDTRHAADQLLSLLEGR